MPLNLMLAFQGMMRRWLASIPIMPESWEASELGELSQASELTTDVGNTSDNLSER